MTMNGIGSAIRAPGLYGQEADQFRRVDRIGEEGIGAEEFSQLAAMLDALRGRERDASRVDEDFQRLDGDGNGRLTVEELSAGDRPAGPPPRPYGLESMQGRSLQNRTLIDYLNANRTDESSSSGRAASWIAERAGTAAAAYDEFSAYTVI